MASLKLSFMTLIVLVVLCTKAEGNCKIYKQIPSVEFKKQETELGDSTEKVESELDCLSFCQHQCLIDKKVFDECKSYWGVIRPTEGSKSECECHFYSTSLSKALPTLVSAVHPAVGFSYSCDDEWTEKPKKDESEKRGASEGTEDDESDEREDELREELRERKIDLVRRVLEKARAKANGAAQGSYNNGP